MFRVWMRLLINPSWHPSAHLEEKVGQRLPFHNPREDGAKDYEVTEKLIKKFKALEAKQFDPKFSIASLPGDSSDKVEAFFGKNDMVVNGKPEYLEHYARFTDFDGGHRLDPETTLKLIIPRILELSD